MAINLACILESIAKLKPQNEIKSHKLLIEWLNNVKVMVRMMPMTL